nr:hypothetical protein [Rhodopseudomonas sp. BR0M22]
MSIDSAAMLHVEAPDRRSPTSREPTDASRNLQPVDHIMMLKGLYKVEFETPRRKAVGVLFASDGKLHGGSSAFAYIGVFEQSGHTIQGTITARRHTVDPSIQSVFGVDEVRIDFHGSTIGDYAQVDGIAAEAPSLCFKAVLTRICG